MKFNKVIVFFVTFLFLMILAGSSSKDSFVNKNVKLSDFINELQTSQLSYIKFTNNVAIGEKSDGAKIRTTFPEYYVNNFIDLLTKKDVQFEFISAESQKTFFEKILTVFFFIIQWLPMLIISWIMIMPFIKNKSDKKDGGIGGGGFMGMNPFNFGKSKARAIMPDELKVKFKDVAGIDEAKEDLVEIVDFLKEPEKYIKIGAKIPKGCLLIGQPGTGKTLLAKAIASEAKVPFFFISGSDFVEMFVGVGASRVRDMFGQAKKQAPCIIFIDEIDAVGRHRGVGMGGGNDEREQTLNQMLVEMDGFNENAGIVVIAATNRVDVLDPALLRPGRFDRQIHVSLPDIKGRKEILEVHASKIKLANNVDLSAIARGTPGFSGADLANLINEGALLAARNGNRIVTTEFLEMAKDKILMGAERKSMVMLEKEKKLTAYHEAGHAILALNLPHSDPIHKATIIPRGRALGLVMRLPENDRLSMTRMEMIANIKVAMGGRIAEEIIFGIENVTSGASSDIEQITKIARDMITKWGLGDSLGMINYSNTQKERYEGDSSARADISEKTSEMIDKEIKALVDECYSESKSLLIQKSSDLELLAKALLQYETLTGDEINALIIDKVPFENIKNNSNDLNYIKKSSVFNSVKKKKSDN